MLEQRLAEMRAELLAEIRAMRAEVQKALPPPRRPAADELIEALLEQFGNRLGKFTAAGLLLLANDEPHSALANALAGVLDMELAPHALATQLGTVLRRLPGLERAGEKSGAALYRVSLGPEAHEAHDGGV
jgi:hypothetical protein